MATKAEQGVERARAGDASMGHARADAEAAPASAAQRIERAVTEEIAAGLVAPGERLDETTLARRFGTSRTPVREALSRLAASGMVEAAPGRGLQVARLGREELGQMFEAMEEIETICANLAAKRMTFLARVEIEAAHRACYDAAEAGDRESYLRANEAFHRAIYDATQNRYVAGIAADFRRRTGPFRAKKFQSAEDLMASARGHDEIMGTLFSNEDGAAGRSMRDHLRRSYMRVLAAN